MYLKSYNNIEVSKKWIPLIFLIKFKDGEFALDVNMLVLIKKDGKII